MSQTEEPRRRIRGQASKKGDRKRHPPTGFGLRLRLLREKAGIDPMKLSLLVDRSRQVVSFLESGVIQSPKSDLAVALARALGTTVEHLEEGDGREPSREEILAAYDHACARKGWK